MKTYSITGTYHGVVCVAKNEGCARRDFHALYKGESILCIKDTWSGIWLQRPPDDWYSI